MSYKVVTQQLQSIVSGSEDADMRKLAIQYKIGEWVKGDHLFCFDTLKQARAFTTAQGYRIFSCRTKGKITTPIVFIRFIMSEYPFPVKELLLSQYLPVVGTVIVSEVMLTREVTNV